ncbi:hypothetical protein GDO86_016082, partial [Hymenochirus boettgeri]
MEADHHPVLSPCSAVSQDPPDLITALQNDKGQKGIQKKNSFLRTVGNVRNSLRLSVRHSLTDKSDSSPKKKEPTDASKDLSLKTKFSFKSKKKLDLENTQESPKTENRPTEGMADINPDREQLSVLEIHGLIDGKHLKEAFENIRIMEESLLREYMSDNNCDSNTKDYALRAKDVNLLYKSLSTVIQSAVKDSLHGDNIDEQLVTSAVYVIKAEEEISYNNQTVSGVSLELLQIGQPRRWKKLWQDTINDSVSERISTLPVNPSENNPWLAEHLELLRTRTVQDLLKVKSSLKPLYPEQYDVCVTYIRAFHRKLSSHLQGTIIPGCKQCSQLYALLYWILNTYRSEEFLQNPDLQPEVNNANLPPLLESECLSKLKNDYNTALQETIRKYMANILKMEVDKWENEKESNEEILKDSENPPLYLDIEEIIGKHVRESAKLSEDLEISAFQICMEELDFFASELEKTFTRRFEAKLTNLFLQNMVTYVNSFLKLRKIPMQSDSEACKKAEDSLTEAMAHITQHFFILFNSETKPYFKKILTKKWLTKDSAFKAIMTCTGDLNHSLKYLDCPIDKEFSNGIHKHLAKEYIAQIMKRKMRLNFKNRKKASQIMSQQWEELNKTACELGSDQEWLFHAVQYISNIIGLRKKDEITQKIKSLFKTYPTI